jgi:Tol biopolymer transport system component/DNA-binding winged helix-turn-helix (wHTH) protein
VGHAESASKIVRFGAFELDLANAELRKNGSKLRLQEQPFKILEALLEQPGAVIAREELVRRLWPEGTYVDFERGLNAAVTRLRQALSDSAENPRYVETVARRGYRFIEEVHLPGAAVVSAPTVREPVPVFIRKKRSSGWLLLAAAATIVIAATGWFWSRPEKLAVERPMIALPLTSDPGKELCASLSPDGSQVVFESDRDGGISHIFIKVVGPGDALRLTSATAPDYGPAWSPDGRSIAFVRRLDPRTIGVFLVPALGGPERKLTEFASVQNNGRADYRWLDWTGDSKNLVVSGAEVIDQFSSSLFTVSATSGERRRLTTGATRAYQGDSSPAVSPDGGAVAFTSGALGSTVADSDLYVLGLTPDLTPAGEPRRLTSGGRYASPVWTPNGRELVFASTNPASPGVFRMSLTNGAMPRLGPAVAAGASFPTLRSTRLVYSRGFTDSNIWRQRIPSGHAKAEPPVSLISSTANDASAQYSPDGTRVVLQSFRSGSAEIWVCASDGGHCAQLTSFNGPHTGTPRWSPDGKRIVFDSAVNGIFIIFVVDANGGVPKRVKGIPGVGAVPSFSRDGKWIYYTSSHSGRSEIWKIESEGGSPVQVTKTGGWTAFESPDGKNLYYTDTNFGTRLWRCDLDGANAAPILDGVAARGFVPTRDQIYYLHTEKTGGVTLKSFALASGATTVIASIPKPISAGLSLSPDGSYLLYSQVDQEGSDLMLVDNFQ